MILYNKQHICHQTLYIYMHDTIQSTTHMPPDPVYIHVWYHRINNTYATRPCIYTCMILYNQQHICHLTLYIYMYDTIESTTHMPPDPVYIHVWYHRINNTYATRPCKYTCMILCNQQHICHLTLYIYMYDTIESTTHMPPDPVYIHAWYYTINNTYSTRPCTVKPVFKGHCDEGTPCDQGTLSQNGVLSSHVKEPMTKGHRSCRDTFSRIQRCPLKTGFTVYIHVWYHRINNTYATRPCRDIHAIKQSIFTL